MLFRSGGDNKPATVSANLMAVSGANGGEECSTYKDCVAALKAGKDIKYRPSPASVRSTTTMTRPPHPSASTSSTAATSRTTTTPRRVPCRRSNAGLAIGDTPTQQSSGVGAAGCFSLRKPRLPIRAGFSSALYANVVIRGVVWASMPRQKFVD